MALTIAGFAGRRILDGTSKDFPANAAGSTWLIDPTGAQPARKLIDLPVSMRPHGLAWTSGGSSVLLSGVEVSSDIVMFDVIR